MLKSLRRNLAFAYTLMAGVILALVALVCLGAAEQQLRAAARLEFDNGVNSIVSKLQNERTLSHAWLAQSEAASHQVIRIDDNGVPISFQGAWVPQTERSVLIQRALDSTDASVRPLPINALLPTGSTFLINGDSHDRYFANISHIPIGTTMLRVVIIRDRFAEDGRVNQLRQRITLMTLGGLLLLLASGWVYSGRAIKPAEESHKRQIEFVSLASHELKSPLAVITASVDALGGDESQLLLRNIRGEAGRMARLVDDLLLLSQADAYRLTMKKQPVETDTLLIECYESFYPIAKTKGVCLKLSLPDDSLPAIQGDPARLKQVLSILLDNAIAYTQHGCHVALGASATASSIRITVSDDGPGIAPEDRVRIFDRFYRADSAHSDRNHAGLGLSIAQELMKMHGGRIFVQGNHPSGTRFILSFDRH